MTEPNIALIMKRRPFDHYDYYLEVEGVQTPIPHAHAIALGTMWVKMKKQQEILDKLKETLADV